MIYIFCNKKYGAPFIRTARRFMAEHRTEVQFIFSGEKSLLKTLQTYLRCGVKASFVKDINAPAFIHHLRPPCHGLIAGFNQIFQASTISKFDSLVNFHPSILPLYRGPIPSYWCLKNREKMTGFTLHKVTERVDAGEILFQKQIPIEQDISPDDLDQKIAREAQPIFWSYLEHLNNLHSWNAVTLDAQNIYKVKQKYAPFL